MCIVQPAIVATTAKLCGVTYKWQGNGDNLSRPRRCKVEKKQGREEEAR
jgi:hypothetical protein